MATSLADTMRKIRACENPMEIAEDPEIQRFIIEADRVGAEILSQTSEDEKIGAVSLLESCVVTDLLTDGEIEILMFAMTHHVQFSGIMAVALKMAVGLAAMEEWK